MTISNLLAESFSATATHEFMLRRQDGTFTESKRARPQPGDEILVVPTVGARTLEVTRGITQILFQIAVVAGVVLDF